MSGSEAAELLTDATILSAEYDAGSGVALQHEGSLRLALDNGMTMTITGFDSAGAVFEVEPTHP